MGGKRLSEFLRIHIITLHQQGMGYKDIHTETKVPTSSVRNVIKRYIATGDHKPGTQPGRPPVLTKHDHRRLLQDAIDDPFKDLASLHAATCLPVSQRTIDRALKDMDIEVF